MFENIEGLMTVALYWSIQRQSTLGLAALLLGDFSYV